jgi:hypothetical protein
MSGRPAEFQSAAATKRSHHRRSADGGVLGVTEIFTVRALWRSSLASMSSDGGRVASVAVIRGPPSRSIRGARIRATSLRGRPLSPR